MSVAAFKCKILNHAPLILLIAGWGFTSLLFAMWFQPACDAFVPFPALRKRERSMGWVPIDIPGAE